MTTNEANLTAAGAWAAYRPTADDPWDIAKVVHLHRAAGFGCNRATAERDLADGPDESIARLLEGEDRARDGRGCSEYESMIAAMDAACRQQGSSIVKAQVLWLYRLLLDPWPLREKMTLAWHTHYATSNQKVNRPDYMMSQSAALRELWSGPMRQLHLRMLREPALLVWLDAVGNNPDRPNENLAREFFELFALGIGHYDEADIRQAARALTGWQQKYVNGSVIVYDAAWHDAGEKRVFGQTGPWNDEELARIACEQPAAAQRIAWRLWRTFISDTGDPPPDVLEGLAAAMRIPGDVDVRRGIEVVLASRIFHAPQLRGRRVLSPVEFIAAALTALEIAPPEIDLGELNRFAARMGQQLYLPPNVAGWPGGLEWLTGPAAVARANFAAWIASDAAGVDPAHFVEVAARGGRTSLDQQLDGLAELLLGQPLPAQTRARLLGAAETAGQNSRAVRTLMSGLLATPEAQVA